MSTIGNNMKNIIETIEEANVKNIIANYSDHLENGFVSVTAWANGEGFDVDLNSEAIFGITHSQWISLKKAVKELMK